MNTTCGTPAVKPEILFKEKIPAKTASDYAFHVENSALRDHVSVSQRLLGHDISQLTVTGKTPEARRHFENSFTKQGGFMAWTKFLFPK